MPPPSQAPPNTPRKAPATRAAIVLVVLALALLGVMALRMGMGSAGWPEGNLFHAIAGMISHRHFVATVPMEIRLVRIVEAALVGAALATGGVALQVLLRNPLAEPFILGLSSGAGLGVTVQLFLAYHLQQMFGASHLGALAGALVTMAIVFVASRRRGTLDPVGLLLVGVVISTINGAFILLLNYLPGPAGLRNDIAQWMVGSLMEMDAMTIRIVAVSVVMGIALLFCAGRAMDVATFSAAEAMSLGVNLHGLRTLLFLLSSMLAAAAVVLAGPIAFVGLICPHIARLLLGPRHRPLIVASALLGAMLIILADTASVAIDLWLGIGFLPMGIFTAIIGGPAFLWMLRPQLGRGVE